jgi:hypothetical protein
MNEYGDEDDSEITWLEWAGGVFILGCVLWIVLH